MGSVAEASNDQRGHDDGDQCGKDVSGRNVGQDWAASKGSIVGCNYENIEQITPKQVGSGDIGISHADRGDGDNKLGQRCCRCNKRRTDKR